MDIQTALSAFLPVSLEEMSGIRLMNRTDTKFVTSLDKLSLILQFAVTDYRVQEVEGTRNIAYRTVYLDTSGRDMYMAHQNGHRVREKIRVRTYVSSGLTFLEVKNKDTLTLGKHELTFVFAPMVHWPEVMVTYDSKDKVLFSADGFGKFGALDVEEDWDCEARRYYIGIVGKYGAQVQNLLKVAATLDIQIICPLHGPVLTENLEHYIGQYNTWSSYGTESEGVMIAYTSVYGNTKKAVELLAEKLKEKGCPKVVVTDLAREDMAEAVEEAFRYGKIVLASTTYNGDVFPFMKTFIEHLTERNYQNKTIGLIENGSWASMAGKVMTGMFEKSKNITWLETSVKIMSSMDEQNKADIEKMAEELM